MEAFNCTVDTKTVNPNSISINKFNLTVGTKILYQDSPLKLSKGIYGLIGPNGCGKSTLLKHISTKQLPVHEKMLVLYVEQEIEASDSKTPVQVIFEANQKLIKLKKREAEIENMLENNLDGNEHIIEEYDELQQQLDSLSIDKQEPKIRQILAGLGFTVAEMDYPISKFSGGWRMRISLGRALYMEPDIMLLDEPTNHLDLLAVIWLSEYLSQWNKIVLLVSHNVGFLNNVCNNILNIEDKKIVAYKGNYYQFKKAMIQKQKTKEKEWNKFEKKIKSMRKNKNKTKKDVDKFIKTSTIKKPPKEYKVNIPFEDVPEFKDNVIKVENASFSYGDKLILKDVDFGIDMTSRITIVGKNGSGKSTLMKMLMGELIPKSGSVWRQDRLRISYYHQHFDSQLPKNKSPVEFLDSILHQDMVINGNRIQTIRKYLGHVGLSGKNHLSLINELSGGQKARVALVKIIFERPHLILMDEPTNHLDLETIQGLIDGLKEYNGGLVVITHEPELITQLDSMLFIVEKNKVIKWKGSFEDYVEKII